MSRLTRGPIGIDCIAWVWLKVDQVEGIESLLQKFS